MSYDSPLYNLPRFCEGDIYGFSVLTNPNPNDIDDISNNWPYVDDDLRESYFSTNHAGGIIAEGAVGMQPNSNLNYLKWPAEAADRQQQKNDTGYNNSNTPRQPTLYKYQWYDTESGEVKNSNKITMSSAFHECYYIDKWGKLKALGTAYQGKAAMLRMFNNSGPQIQNGCDPRLFEIWQADPFGFGYDPDINLVHITCAADETIATLDSNGTIRIIQAGIPGVILEGMGSETEWQVVYFDKEDIANGFWIDEDGENVFMDNVDFVDVWCSGGGTSSQGICVWALHKSGKLYGQHMHSMFWLNRDFNFFDPRTGEFMDYLTQGAYKPTPYMIRPLDEEGGEMDPVVNLYHGAYVGGPQQQASNEDNTVLDRYGYNSRRYMGSVSSGGAHFSGVSSYFGIDITNPNNYIEDPKYTEGIYPRWNNEAIRHALNQIPRNELGNRYKVIAMFDGYGHGGGCICVDPDVPSGDGHSINQRIEPVLLNTWTAVVHRHMYEHIHLLKKWRSVRDSDGFYTHELNNQGTFAFDNEVYDLLFKSDSGTYEPPIRFSSTRRNFCILTCNGMVASFQGSGDGTKAPLINYRLNEDDFIEPVLDSNDSSRHEYGNWFFNCDLYDPVTNPFAGQVLQWFANYSGPGDAGPDKGPHVIAGGAGDPQVGGRFGFGFMPPAEDGTYPGINPDPWRVLEVTPGWDLYFFNYFSYIDYLGYDFEKNYWNMDSLVYFRTIEDEQGRTLRSHPNEFHRGNSAIHIFHAGEGSPYAPFNENPVVWWCGQGDNINAIFKNGVVDSCTYFEAQMSSFVWPPAALPLTQQQEDPVPHNHPHPHTSPSPHDHPHPHTVASPHLHPHPHETDPSPHNHWHPHEEAHNHPHPHEPNVSPHDHPHPHTFPHDHPHPHTIIHDHPHPHTVASPHNHPHPHEDEPPRHEDDPPTEHEDDPPTEHEDGGGRGDEGSFQIGWDTPEQLPDANEKSQYTAQITATYIPAGGGEGEGEGEGEGDGADGGGGAVPVDSYELLEGVFPPGVELNSSTGAVVGLMPELDSFVPAFQNPPDDLETIPAPYTEAGFIPAYAQWGSTTLSDGTRTIPYPITFKVGAIVAGKVQSEREFTINIINNWNSDRDYFISSVFGPQYLEQLKYQYWGD